MAEQSVHDVVNQTLSVGDNSPSDADVDKSTHHAAGEEVAIGEAGTDNHAPKTSNPHGQRVQPDVTSYPTPNEQNHNELLSVQPGFAETGVPADSNTQDSDFDGNISRNQSVGDLSTASDNDTHKVEPLSTSEDTKNQDASNAARRTASFKPVSFAKYSAAKAVGFNAAAKSSSDKVMSSANSSAASLQQGSRPRLVAKAASGLRDNTSKMFKTGSRNGVGGPDPMQVWNKNRPAPPPSTKHLTDEELKQQYGIHMTSRIEADGESKEAKWADIDDDEDDWAPETIEWADGTKVVLNHTSNMPLTQETVGSETPRGVQTIDAQPTRPRAPQIISSVGPNATVLKLGASAERQQAQKATMSQKGPSEKPAASAAKSPAPVPAKSPWASLPPVDKVSPITINPQIPMPPPNRIAQVSPGGASQSPTMASSPAKEISADDFNRSWRESQPAQPRELFMPNSGRYEAVGENRRRSSRNEQNFRAPALLQRPSASDYYAPAEPSPAFQTSRISSDQERGSWNRRRASSIHSGGSGQFGGRRVSVSKGGEAGNMLPEIPQQQRGSSQGSADVVTSLRGVHVQQNTNLPPTPSTAGLPAQAADMALVAEQKRLMQESARLAVKRRQEEEQKEEAARKERIRLKMEQLPPLPDQKAKVQEQKSETSPKPEEPIVPISSPPKPPVPEATGEPKQYGMMKVHHPDNVKKFSPIAEKSGVTPETKVQDVQTSPNLEAARGPASIIDSAQSASEESVIPSLNEAPKNLSQSEESTQAWKGSQAANGSLPGWTGANHHPSPATSNLWGPPNHDKALGNGTFNQRLIGLSARDLSMRNNGQQQSWLNGRPSSHDRSPQLPPMRAIPPENVQSTVSFPSPEQRPIAANSEVDSLHPIGKPSPIGPPHAQISHPRWQPSSNVRPANNGLAAWNNFHAVAAREDRAEHEKFQRDLAASLEEEARTGVRRAPQYTFNETWKQVEVGDHSGDRQVTTVAKGSINPPFPPSNSYGALGANFTGDRAVNGLPIRGSRFFPTEARRAVTFSHPEVPRSPSPPPAEELGSLHPVYDGDTMRPVINFPVPKAVVKLPKPQARASPTLAPPAPPRTFAAAVAAQPPVSQPSFRAVSQPLASTPDWQHRFNDLLGRKSPPKKYVLEVASSSKEPLDVVPLTVLAVSLPPKETDMFKDAGKVTSKDVEEEEDLFEDREAASTPLVQVPRDVPENLWRPARVPQFRPKGRYFKPEIDPVSVLPFDSAEDNIRAAKGKEIILYIHLPGTSKSSRKTLQRKAVNNGHVSRPTKPHNFNNKQKKGPPKARESSGSFQNVQQQNGNRANSTRTPPSAPNGLLPTPRSGFSHNSNSGGWRGGHFASAGMAH